MAPPPTPTSKKPPSDTPFRPPANPAPTPLMPTPTPPAFLTGKDIKIAPSTENLSSEEKVQVWNDRIELLAKSVQIHTELTRIDKDKDIVRVALASSRVASSRKEELKTKLSKMDSYCAARKVDIDKCKSELAASDTWPITRVVATPQSIEKQQTEVLSYVKELHRTTEEIQALLRNLDAPQPSKPDAPPEAQPKVSTPQNEPVRPGKRRRLSDGEVAVAAAPANLSAEEYERLDERVRLIETRLEVCKNDLVAHDNELRDEISDRVGSQLDEIRTAQAELEEEQALPDRLNSLEEQFTRADNDIRFMAHEVAELIDREKATKEDLKLLRADLQRESSNIDQMQANITQALQKQSEHALNVEAMTETLKSLQLAPPAPAPVRLPSELILPLLEAPVTNIVMTEVEPRLKQNRDRIEKRLHQQKDEVYKTLVAKLENTQSTLEKIAQHVTSLGSS
ncbi:hypothetical protein HGRIS_013050 [Hohenbuehelia grisea]